ncbi:MAG: ABC transporter permease [Gemmatimonadaceae bacterium]|nr:ABC transporter permease [Gemmatimonadaceae bacterium]
MHAAGRRSVAHWIARRVALTTFTIAAALAVTFALLSLAPGDPLALALDSRELPAEALARLRAVYALDQPPLTRFLTWCGALLRGDLGWSLARQEPVRDVLRGALPNTLVLCGLAGLLAFALGSALGAWQGAHAHSRRDHASSLISLGLYAIPEFVLALLLLLVFAWRLRWFPAGGVTGDFATYLGTAARLRDRLQHLVLPVGTLALIACAVVSRYQRAAMIDAVREPFVRAARARGATERRVLVRHAWRAALSPLVTLLGLYLPVLVGGSLFVERVFAWPGMGSALADAVLARDYPVVLAIVAIGSAATALGALVSDLLHPLSDPRVAQA